MRSTKSWQPLIDKFRSKLTVWKAKTFSIGGRCCLCKSILGALGTYMFSLYKAPKKVLNILEGYRSRFLWGDTSENKKIHWMAWDKVLRDKHCGGLGIGSLRALNLALLTKWRWKEKTEAHAKWIRIVKGCSVSNSNHGIWNTILGVDKDLNEMGINVYTFLKLSEDGSSWVWELEPCNKYTVRSMRKLIDGVSLPVDDKETEWIRWLPSKSNIHLWRVLHNRLPTLDNLTKRARILHAHMANWVGWWPNNEISIKDLWGKINSAGANGVAAVICKIIGVAFLTTMWKARNNKVFKGEVVKDIEIAREVQTVAFNWVRLINIKKSKMMSGDGFNNNNNNNSSSSPSNSLTASLIQDHTSSNPNPNSSTSAKRKRNLPGTPDPDAEVIALSPRSLMATNRFVCEICNKGFQRDQNLQLHRRGHNLPWKLKQRNKLEVVKKKVYICPEKSCVHHDPSRALGDLTGVKKHFSRKHGEKKWKCEKCSKKYAVQSDWKAHSKICGTREYKCDCGTLFSRKFKNGFFPHDVNYFTSQLPKRLADDHAPVRGGGGGQLRFPGMFAGGMLETTNLDANGSKPRLPIWLDQHGNESHLENPNNSSFLGPSSSNNNNGGILPTEMVQWHQESMATTYSGIQLKEEINKGKCISTLCITTTTPPTTNRRHSRRLQRGSTHVCHRPTTKGSPNGVHKK
ncbi:hypothetical protein OSB04_010253 [Centaurea solstitialis]|uniref:C2H2-type domain-containing protein n=1 Tax=Centaurea solstitialis TaxID=347529 RepID=A0AA38T8W0_9ASTR|nr:hypothetical protein OSB04_010253 [Centaurea solstitialis]